MSALAAIDARVLMIGAGGLAAACGTVLARSGVMQVDFVDDDRVETGNLHRQLWFDPGDRGTPKAPCAARRIRREAAQAGYAMGSAARELRVLPANVLEVVEGYDLIVEGADNFATKFLVADACALEDIPVVHAAAVRWTGWTLGVVPHQSACLRCVFEDIPAGQQASCDAAGVMGPVVGVVGALQAVLALRLLEGDRRCGGELWSYAALQKPPRRTHLHPRAGCAACSGAIDRIDPERYVSPVCAV